MTDDDIQEAAVDAVEEWRKVMRQRDITHSPWWIERNDLHLAIANRFADYPEDTDDERSIKS